MARFTAADVRALQAWPASRADVARKLHAALESSVGVRVTVDTINDLTGEYRIVLQGTLEASPSKEDRRIASEETFSQAA